MAKQKKDGGAIPLWLALPALGALACVLLCGMVFFVMVIRDPVLPDEASRQIITPLRSPTQAVSESILLSASIDEGCGEVVYYWGQDSRVFRPEEGLVCVGRNFHVGDEDVPYEIETATIAVDCFGAICTCSIRINARFLETEGEHNSAICTWDK